MALSEGHERAGQARERDTAMTAKTVVVTAEWAWRGKRESDRGYSILAHSKGKLGQSNFEEVLTRYSPGTLESLPQVTLSWISSAEAGANYLAIAIHELADDGMFDRDGRTVMFTRYFCAPMSICAGVPLVHDVV